MSNVKFVLKEPNKKEETLIYLIYRYSQKRFKYYIGYKVHPKNWNNSEQKARGTTSNKDGGTINVILTDLRAGLPKHHRELIGNRIEPTNELFKQYLDNYFYKTKTEKRKDGFFEFIDNYIKECSKSDQTKKHYRTTYNKLLDYQSKSGINLTFESIGMEFYDSFSNYLKAQDYSLNSIGSYFKHIKVFMNEAYDRDLTKNLQFKNKNFKVVEEDADSIYLTTKEIQKIYDYDFSKTPHIERVRDLFVIGCYTGLRFSDLTQFRQENISKDLTTAKVRTQKTGEVVIIPLNPLIKAILKKHGGKPPEAISNQKMNDYLKTIGENVKINDEVVISITKGGVRVRESFKKHELITVHTARRSFATNAYLNDVPTLSIMKMTGHTTEKAFLKYIKISQEDNANKLLNHPFFK